MLIDPVCLQHVQGLFLLLHKRCTISIYLPLRFPAHSTSIESGGCDGVSLSTTHRGVLQRWEKLEKDGGRWREWQMEKKKENKQQNKKKKNCQPHFSVTSFFLVILRLQDHCNNTQTLTFCTPVFIEMLVKSNTVREGAFYSSGKCRRKTETRMTEYRDTYRAVLTTWSHSPLMKHSHE